MLRGLIGNVVTVKSPALLQTEALMPDAGLQTSKSRLAEFVVLELELQGDVIHFHLKEGYKKCRRY
jgi:hypothetical protein